MAASIIGLIKLFKSTDEAGTQMQARFDAIKGVATLLKGVIVDLAGVFNLLIQGKFKKAFQEFKDVLAEFKDTAGETYDRIVNVTTAMDALEDVITASISSQAELLKDFREYINLSKDQTKSDSERAKNLTLAEAAAKKYYGNLRDFENDRFNLEVEKQAARVGIASETLAEFIKLNGEEAENVRQNNDEIRKAWKILGDDVIKSLEEQYVKAIDADTMYFKRTNEITSLRTGLIKKMYNDRLAAQKEYIDEELELDESLIDEEIENIDKLIQADNARIENEINLTRFSIDEKIRLEEKLASKRQQLYSESLNIFNSFVNREIELTARKYDLQIQQASKAGKDTTKLEQEKAIKLAEIERKSAIVNKVAESLEVAITTTKSVFKLKAQAAILASNPITALLAPLALAQIPFVIGAGVLATGAILAEPLPEVPSFFKGSDGKKVSGLVELHGQEGVKTDKGGFYTNWDKHQGKLINLQTPAEIIPNEDVIKYDLDKTIKLGDGISLQGGITKEEFERISKKQTEDILKGLEKNQSTTIIKDDKFIERKRNQTLEYFKKRY